MINNFFRQLLSKLLILLAEKIAEPVVEAATPADTRKAMPIILKELDKKMPELLATAGPVTMTSAIATIAEEQVGRIATGADIKAIVRKWSPIIATLRDL